MRTSLTNHLCGYEARRGFLAFTVAVFSTMMSACNRDQAPTESDSAHKELSSKWTERLEQRTTRGRSSSVAQVIAQLRRDEVSTRIDRSSVELLKKLAESDPQLAFNVYLSDPQNLNMVGFDEVSEVICRLHPDFVARWLKGDLEEEISDEENRTRAVMILVNGLTQTDSTQALEVLDFLPKEGGLYESAMQAVFIRLGNLDASAALTEAKSRFSGKQLDSAIEQIARGQSSINLNGALKTLELMSDNGKRSNSLATIVGELGHRSGYQQIKEFVSSADGRLLGEMLLADSRALFSGMIFTNDLDAVGRALDSMALTEHNRQLYSSYLSSEVARDPDAAFAYLQEIPDSPLKASITESMFRSISDKDIDVALEKLSAINGEARDLSLKAIATSAGKKGMDNVISVAHRLEGSAREHLIANSLGQVCMNDFEGAKKYVDSGNYLSDTTGDQSRSAVVQAVSKNYTSRDPEAAFNWIDSLDESSKPAAMGAYAAERAKVDIAGLAEQLSGMPKNETWRSGVKVLISQLRTSDPQMAAAWEQALGENK